MKNKAFIAVLLIITLLSMCLTACTDGTESPSSSAPESSVTEPQVSEAEPTPAPEPTTSPSPEVEELEQTAELEVMYPILEAHVLALLNGGSFNADDPEYFWQTVTFAIDGCGMDFYSSETMGNALVLSRGVIEEIASALFEDGGNVLLEIPESLSGDIQYDTESDAFAHPLGEAQFSIELTSAAQDADGVIAVSAELMADGETVITGFTAELVSNTRAGNSLFTLSVRSIELSR